MQELKDILLSQAQDLGANLCGVADLTTDSQWIRENYGDLCASFPRAVSIAIFFPREIIQEQAVGPTRSYSYFYAATVSWIPLDFVFLIFCSKRDSAPILYPPLIIDKLILFLDYRSRSLLRGPKDLKKCKPN